MKKSMLAAVAALAAFLLPMAGYAQTTGLPAARIKKGPAIIGIFSNRQSTTKYDSRPLSKQDLADLLWCAMGKNRDDGKLTAPTASNKQEVRLFVFDAEGVSEYLPQSHELKQVAKDDNRDLVAGPSGLREDCSREPCDRCRHGQVRRNRA